MSKGEFRDQLCHLEQRSLAWVVERQRYFNPLLYTENLKIDLALKASAELALVCADARADRASELPPQYQQLASYVWTEVFSADAVRDHLLTTELGLLTFGFYASLRHCGYRDERYERELQTLLDDGYVSAAERVPTRELDFLHSLQKLALLSDRNLPRQVYERCLIAKHPSLYPLTTDDVYALTHAIFFMTDFGRIPGWWSTADLEYLRGALPRLSEYYLRKGNWDVVAELLICLSATGLSEAPIYGQSLALLCAAQQEDGSIPGPTREQRGRQWAATTANDDDANAEWRVFHDNYHTTLVALMAVRGAMSRDADKHVER